jgi:flagellar protein FliS
MHLMNAHFRQQYLENEVTTATPQKLQWMLHDAAIRFATRASQLWQQGKLIEATDAMGRSREVVAHLLGGLRREHAPELVTRVAAEYSFVLRTLVLSSIQHDQKKLQDALQVLEIHRDTWASVCQELGESFAPVVAHAGSPLPARHVPAPTTVDLPSERFSMDA